ECKRLIEIDFPIAEVSAQSAREKSIRHGHPSTLHYWWARRPLAACRSVLLESLLPDPNDPMCPADFKQEARIILTKFFLEQSGDLREDLVEFVANYSNWNNSSRTDYVEASRSLVKAAYPESAPVLVDPFAGGGSIPLEALRMGCEAFASDLNPVAALI